VFAQLEKKASPKPAKPRKTLQTLKIAEKCEEQLPFPDFLAQIMSRANAENLSNPENLSQTLNYKEQWQT
jgi:hypothetical protein